jgi:hypothetical protein
MGVSGITSGVYRENEDSLQVKGAPVMPEEHIISNLHKIM